MSEPRNHHYVTKSLIKHFVDENGIIAIYDKHDFSFKHEPLSRFDFAEYDLNSTIDQNNLIDHKTVEAELDSNFETRLPHHYKKIKEGLSNGNYTDLILSIEYILNLGIIGEMRNPNRQEEKNQAIQQIIDLAIEHGVDRLKNEAESIKERVSKVKNKFPTKFKEVAQGVKEIMGETIYSIFRTPLDEFLFLPDTTSVVIRTKLEPDIISDSGTLASLALPISTVIMPIDSNTILTAQTTKICPQKNHGIYELNTDQVYKYNKMFFEYAFEKVACKSIQQLKEFVKRYNDNAE